MLKTKSIKSRTKQIILISIVLLFLILALIFDQQINTAIQNLKNSAPVLDAFFSVILLLENKFIFYPLIIIAPAIILLCKKRKRSIPRFFLSLFISISVCFLFKNLIGRQRPVPTTNDSFPSGHSTAVFTALPFFKHNIHIIWFILACLFAFTRIWFGLHYLSDVIAGAIIGYGASLIIQKILK